MFQLGGSVKEPTTLEGAVAPLAGFRGGLYKDCVFDVSAQKDAKAATSLADINHEDDCDRLDAITTDSFQRFAFLIMIGRVGTINLDDVLVRPAEGGGLALVYGDVKRGRITVSEKVGRVRRGSSAMEARWMSYAPCSSA